MEKAQQIMREVAKALVGKDEIIRKVTMCVLCKGHILLEDIPGVGKTTLAIAFSRALSLDYSRVQFTPDVLPSDITGFTIYNKETGKMQYQKGAIICNLFLADEINRATSRTQAALLEAMEEMQVTVDGVSHKIPAPFTVIATQNPVGAHGTQLLPDSQMDRFMVRLSIGYPDFKSEFTILKENRGMASINEVESVTDSEGLIEMQNQVSSIYVNDEVFEYIVRLSDATRNHDTILQGASPRASIAVTKMSRAAAYLDGRDYVIPQDVKTVFSDVIKHRLILSPKAKMLDQNADKIVSDILEKTKEPKIGKSVS